MDTEVIDAELIARLKRLDASADDAGLAFDYGNLIARHATRQTRARRRLALARGAASALVIALVSVSVWRFDRSPDAPPPVVSESVDLDAAAAHIARVTQPRIVRADTYLAVAALEDHIATLDDALNDARLNAGSAEVARLERTRAELLDSYTRVRYAQMVSANY